MTNFAQQVLEEVTRIPGVRGALLVSEDDGLIVAEALMEGVDGPAVAALAASLTGRLGRATRALGKAAPVLLHLQATGGAVFSAAGGEGLLLVAVTAADVNAGLVRLSLLDAAGRLS